MNELFLFTSTFPYGTGESFLETEIIFLAEKFDKITIIPYKYGDQHLRDIPKNVSFTEPLRSEYLSAKTVLIKGLFNFNPIWPFLKELIKYKFFKLNLIHLERWFREMMTIRMILNLDFIKKKFKKNSNPHLLYFYWGTITSGIIPYINKNNISVVRFHGGDLYEEIDQNNGYIPFRQNLLKNLHYAIFISSFGQNYLNHRYNKINIRQKIFRLGVKSNGAARTSTDGVFRIVSCSSLTKIKRVHIIAQALAKIPFKLEWTHIGDGPEKKFILDIIKTQNISYSFHFTGQISNKELIDYYLNNAVDLFVHSSESEGIPVSIMEALSFSIPVISTNVGGTSEIMKEMSDNLLPIDSTPDIYAKKIIEYIVLSEKEKQNSRKMANYCWQTYANAEKNYSDFTNFLKQIMINL